MDFTPSEVRDILLKKAKGFSYEEVTKEFERIKPCGVIFCEKRNRVYFNFGFLKVVKTLKNNDIKGFKHKKMRFFTGKIKNFSKFKFICH